MVMRSIISTRHVNFCLILLIIYLIIVIYVNFPRLSSPIRRKVVNFHCLQSQSIDHQLCTTHPCSRHTHANTILWTHDGTGMMKYIHWMITRKLINFRMTELDDDCCIIKETYFPSNSSIQRFVQIYIVSLSADLSYQSACSIKISQTATGDANKIHQIYFRRQSVTATVVFQQLDLLRHNHHSISNSNQSYFRPRIDKASEVIKQFSKNFAAVPSNKWKIINSEDLIHSNLIDCERLLTNFVSLLGLNTSVVSLKNIIEYDSHRFIQDATWWDQSEVAERLLNMSIPARPTNFTYKNDFYHLHGTRSFAQYLSDNRQCYNDGTFAQMHSETITNRNSSNQDARCVSDSFDCAFGDMYSFDDREHLYKQPSHTPTKCGFAIPSIFDKVRKQYGRNQTCETIILTSIVNCYDPLPGTEGDLPPSTCCVALVDTRTYNALQGRYPKGHNARWDIIDLGENASLFSFPAKTVEILKTAGQRMFPLAKWIIWLDGKAYLMRIIEVLTQAQASVFAPRHTEVARTSAIEVNYTIDRIRNREKPFSAAFNKSVMDIERQETEYKRDGFYARSDALNLRLYDIALFVYRNNHPCNFRYLCGWQNEINYFAYRGQLSVYYSAVRLNITHHLHILPRKFYHTFAHGSICHHVK